MYKLCRIDIKNCEAIIEQLKTFVSKLKDSLPVKEVYIYGSFAKGEIHEGSDIDLIIIGDFKERFFDRIGKIIDLTDLPIEPLVYTEEEFQEMRNSGNPFIKEIMKTAIRLF